MFTWHIYVALYALIMFSVSPFKIQNDPDGTPITDVIRLTTWLGYPPFLVGLIALHGLTLGRYSVALNKLHETVVHYLKTGQKP